MATRAHLIFPLKILKNSAWKFYEDDGPFLARGLAFGLLIYCIPLCLLTVSLLSYTVVGSDRALFWVRGIAQVLMPQFRDEFGAYLASVVSNRGLLGIAGVLAFLVVSSTTFGSLRLVLNKVFQVPEHRGLLHGKVMEMVMMLVTSALFFIVIAVVYLLVLVEGFLVSLPFAKFIWKGLEYDFPALGDYIHPGALGIAGAGSFMLTVGLFWFLYRYSSSKTPGQVCLIVGAFTAAALFEISKVAFAWYVGYAHGIATLYGTLSAVAFIFLWFYYGCLVFVFGAEVAWVLEKR